MIRATRRWGILALAGSLALPILRARAAWADDSASASARGPVAGSAWEQTDFQEGFALDNPTYNEKQNFGYNFENSGFRNCDGFPYIIYKVPFNYTWGQIAGAGSGMENLVASGMRKFLRDPVYGRLYLDDEANLNPTLGGSWQLANLLGRLPISLFASASYNGNSGVARPLPNPDSCAAIRRFLKLTDFKTVLPLSARRISEMIPGEIWRVPAVFTVRIGPSTGLSAGGETSPRMLNGASNTALLEDLNLIVSFTAGKSKSATITLRRLDSRNLRARIRLADAVIKDAQGNIYASPPVMQLAQPWVQALIASRITRLGASGTASYVAQQILRALTATLTLDAQKSSGGTVILEYILNPDDAGQMRALAKLLRGDLDVFKQLLKFRIRRGMGATPSQAEQQETLSELEARHSKALKLSPHYAGMGSGIAKSLSLIGNVPFLGQFSRVRTREKDSYVEMPRRGRGKDGGSSFRIFNSQRNSVVGLGNLPFVGALITRNRNRRVQTIVSKDPQGEARGTSLLYLNQHAGLRRAKGLPKKEIEDINSIMRYAGTGGRGVNRRMEIPPPRILPAPGTPVKKFTSNFTLYISSTGMDSVLSASRNQILEAFWNAMPSAGASTLRGSWRRRRYARRSERLAADAERIRAVSDRESQAELFDGLWSGRRRSKTGFSDVFKVLLQLVDPSELAAEVSWSIVTKIDEGSRKSYRFVLNPGLLMNPDLKNLSQTKSRYIPPQPLSD